MKDKKKLKLKKFNLHPITTYTLLIIITILVSGILSMVEMQNTYNVVNPNTLTLEPTLVAVENLMSPKWIKEIISKSTLNFISFTPLVMLLISLIGITVAEGTGFIRAFTEKYLKNMPNQTLTFIILLIATMSSLINEVGYAILIPLSAIIFFIKGRNPLLGIITAFSGVAFGYGVSIFVGSTELALMEYTKTAAELIDENIHIALTSNLFFIIATTIITSIVGSIIIEKIIAPKIGKYKKEDIDSATEQYGILSLEEEAQKQIEKEKREKTGLKYALITMIVVLIIFIYSLIPNLPYSGLLLDMNEETYLNQLFGENSYFQDGFTAMVSLLFLSVGIAYGIGSKNIKNDKELIEVASEKFSKIGSILLLLFIASQFITVFRLSNIGVVLTGWLARLVEILNFDGIMLVLITLILIAIANLLLTSPATKWMIFSPIVVPLFMQSNISPEFAQIVMRVGDSMTNGYTVLLASFAIYLGYLNIYNLNKNKPIGIKKSISMIAPYFVIINITWILIILGWFIIGLPIGPGVFPTI